MIFLGIAGGIASQSKPDVFNGLINVAVVKLEIGMKFNVAFNIIKDPFEGIRIDVNVYPGDNLIDEDLTGWRQVRLRSEEAGKQNQSCN